MIDPAVQELIAAHGRDPHDGSAFSSVGADLITTVGGQTYPIVDGHAVLIARSSSLFDPEAIAAGGITTQRREYRDARRVKNRVRLALPPLGQPNEAMDRLRALADGLAPDATVLVLGAGEKVDDYRALFAPRPVVTSDVHLLHGADLAADAHSIPFEPETFDLVVAEQVLEHTARAWVVAAEMERVCRRGGTIHAGVPFAFPWHAEPHDHVRFTPTGLRFLFPRSRVLSLAATDGAASAAATYLVAAAVESSGRRRIRQVLLGLTRIAVAWLPLLDRRRRGPARAMRAARGLAITVTPDGLARSDHELMDDVRDLTGTRR